ncbi:MAG: hypothetical protein ACFB0C_12315 [Leptolyngbyaceae cyanobacterium]
MVSRRMIAAILGAIALSPTAIVPWDQSFAQADETDSAVSEEITSPTPAPYLRPLTTCPVDLETLITGLIRDVPSYANRVARRQLGVNDAGFGTVLVAGQAELEPLDISDRLFNSGEYDPESVDQVFFTTLERQYTETEQVNLQQFHWLFLTEADDGWRLAFMFSRLGAEGSSRPPTPPEESSNAVIGQAVRLWLRDCRAGAIDPIEASASEGLPAETGR